jgi:CheY-like chemotaxis protein
MPFRGNGELIPAGFAKLFVRVSPDDGTLQARDTEPVRPRVLIVDDHEGFRAVARTLLQGDGLDVVGEAVDGAGALAETSDLRPDLVLLDVHLPDADGFAISEFLAALPNPPVVVLISSRPISDLRSRLKSSSAAGFLAKHQLSGSNVMSVARGRLPWSKRST